jgi:hypothetical protein
MAKLATAPTTPGVKFTVVSQSYGMRVSASDLNNSDI